MSEIEGVARRKTKLERSPGQMVEDGLSQGRSWIIRQATEMCNGKLLEVPE